MPENTVLPLPLLVHTGRVENATYRDPLIPHYRDNPFIEALPPIWTTDEAAKLLMRYPVYEEHYRAQPAELRLHLIYNAIQFFEPLPVHLDLEQRFSRVIRVGYQARNPLERGFWRDTQERVQGLEQTATARTGTRSTAVGFTIVGISGVGKTTSVEAILSLYPQVIFHSRYRDRDFSRVQVVWLKLDCPFDGSTKGLCVNFFQALDSLLGTHYFQLYARGGRTTTDEMIPHIARICSVHGLGVFVIDEIQHLHGAKSGGASKMLNFFVQLVNTIGVPIIPVGTYKALSLLTGEFRQARRGTGQGDLVWDRMAEDDAWQLFVESLWRYQYVRHPSPLTSELSHALYDVSQGITDFAVKAYILAQIRAITTGEERISANIIWSVASDSFRLAHPVLSALKRGDARALLDIEDVHPIDLEACMQDALKNTQIVGRLSVQHRSEENAVLDRSAGANTLEPKPARVPTPVPGTEQTGQTRSEQTTSPERHRQTIVLKGSLPELVLHKQAHNQVAAYEALGPTYLRSAQEYLTAEAI